MSNKDAFKRIKGNHLKIKQTQVTIHNPVVEDIINMPPSDTDPMGSYTGVPLDERETPVQDVDDL